VNPTQTTNACIAYVLTWSMSVVQGHTSNWNPLKQGSLLYNGLPKVVINRNLSAPPAWFRKFRTMQLQRSLAAQPAVSKAQRIHSSCIPKHCLVLRPRSRAPSQLTRAADVQASTPDQTSSPLDVAAKQPVDRSNPNGDSQASAAPSQQAADADQATSSTPSWEDTSTGEEADWVGQKPFSWRDVDWGK
jgi:hypothetical protein